MGKQEKKNTGKIWLKKQTGQYSGVVCFLTLLSVSVTLFSLAFAYLVRYLINSASEGKTKTLWIFAAILLTVLLLKIILKTVDAFCAERIRSKMYTELRTKLFSKLLRTEYGALQKYHSGELINRLTGDVQEICADTVGLLPTVVGMIVQCFGAIAALLTIDPFFTGIYVVCGCILGGLSTLFRRQIKKRHKEVLEAEGATRSFMQEGLTSVMTVKAYGAENKASKKVEELSATYYDKRMKRNILRSEMNFVFSLLSNFGLIFAVVWCGISILGGNDDYGSILSVILLLMQLQQPLTSFSSIIPVYYSRMASAERLAELEKLPEEYIAKENSKVAELYGQMQSIVFQNVSFSYGREEILCNVNARIDKGEIVCLTGASGAGKSTLFKLLLSVYTPTAGGIALVREKESEIVLTEQERSLFAYVPQGNFFFSGTIYENLTFFFNGNDHAVSDADLKNALSVACAEFVYDLPEGLQTKLSENGGGLSEGQLQRLNIARAILSNRPILLLDEATSALDGETEQRLLENVKKVQDKTCLIVTHRPAALQIADRVLRVEKGTIRNDKR